MKMQQEKRNIFYRVLRRMKREVLLRLQPNPTDFRMHSNTPQTTKTEPLAESAQKLAARDKLDRDVLTSVLRPQLNEINADQLRRILYDRLRHEVTVEAREHYAARTIESLRETLPAHGINPLPSLSVADDARMQRHLQEMRSDGITLLGSLINAGQIREINRYLNAKNVYGGHVWAFSDREKRSRDEARKSYSQVSHILSDTLHAPHLIETMSNSFVLKLVEQYLGCVPTIYQSNLMWSFEKNTSHRTEAQSFHRDWDNFHFCVLFVYLTDVTKATGPHQYVRGSHTIEGMRKAIERYHAAGGTAEWAREENLRRDGKLIDAQITELFGNAVLEIEQPAGFAFLADAFGLHRGIPLLEKERLLFWTRYGLYDNGFSVDVGPNPIPRESLAHRMSDDETHRYIFRAVVQSEYSPRKPPTSLHLPLVI